MIDNIFSIDVEELSHAEYVRHTHKKHLDRTEQNIPIILNLLREHKITATFFVVGEIAEKHPDIIKKISEEGHEVSFHGWTHIPLWDMNVNTFRKEVEKFGSLHPKCRGFRAPSFSLNNDTKWALDVIREAGYHYDSSIVPTWTPLYGMRRSPTKIYYPSLDDISKEDQQNFNILEFPLTVYPFLCLNFPIAGGFWLRVLNTGLIEKCIRKLNERGIPAVMFIHNWEVDPDTAKLDLGIFKSFVTYHNLSKSVQKIKYLFNGFRFTSFEEYIKSNIGKI